jgi:hypothetical protein
MDHPPRRGLDHEPVHVTFTCMLPSPPCTAPRSFAPRAITSVPGPTWYAPCMHNTAPCTRLLVTTSPNASRAGLKGAGLFRQAVAGDGGAVALSAWPWDNSQWQWHRCPSWAARRLQGERESVHVGTGHAAAPHDAAKRLAVRNATWPRGSIVHSFIYLSTHPSPTHTSLLRATVHAALLVLHAPACPLPSLVCTTAHPSQFPYIASGSTPWCNV